MKKKLKIFFFIKKRLNFKILNSKNLHRHKEKIKHSNIQWVKDCSPFPQQGQKI